MPRDRIAQLRAAQARQAGQRAKLPPMVDGRTPEQLRADGDDKWPDGTPYTPPSPDPALGQPTARPTGNGCQGPFRLPDGATFVLVYHEKTGWEGGLWTDGGPKVDGTGFRCFEGVANSLRGLCEKLGRRWRNGRK